MRMTFWHDHRLLPLLLLLVPCIHSASLAQQSSPPADMAQATALVSGLKFDEALKIIESLLQTEQEPAKLQQLSLLQAQCYLGLKQPDKALPIYESLTKDSPDPVKLTALQAIANIHLSAGDLAKAEESLRAATGLYSQAEDARLKALGSAQYFRTRVDYDGAVSTPARSFGNWRLRTRSRGSCRKRRGCTCRCVIPIPNTPEGGRRRCRWGTCCRAWGSGGRPLATTCVRSTRARTGCFIQWR